MGLVGNGSGSMARSLFVTFRVGGAGVESSKAPLPAEYLLRDLFINIQCSGKLFLLLFDIAQGLVDVVLLALRG